MTPPQTQATSAIHRAGEQLTQEINGIIASVRAGQTADETAAQLGALQHTLGNLLSRLQLAVLAPDLYAELNRERGA